ncbi:MAG: DNA alkylation repair protein [Bacillota bacterium]
MDTNEAIKKDLHSYIDPERAVYLPKLFQVYSGGYGEGDLFLGVTVPNQRKVSRKYSKIITMNELEELFNSKYHEYRLTAIFILVLKYERAKTGQEQKQLVDFYLSNLSAVNNWDLVDSSAYKILGPYLYDKDKSLLYELAVSNDLWKQRIAMIATYYFIKKDTFAHTFELADLLIDHKHDLIHKAAGWMLREVGNRNFEAEFNFLVPRYKQMPRTMLRYGIEKFEPELRKKFLAGTI